MGLKDILEPKEAIGEVVYEDGSTNEHYDAPDSTPGDSPETADKSRELEKQPMPSDTMCPYCGGEPTDDSVVNHRLSATGYLHDDIQLQCQDCGHEWPVGVPIGEIEDPMAEDLYCDSCEKRFMRVHRVAPDWDSPEDRRRVLLHLKCPNCFYFDKEVRECGDRGIALVGYSDITGSFDDATAYGWSDDADN